VLLNLLTAVVLAFVFVRITQGTRIALVDRREHVIALWKGVRPRHILGAAVMFPIIIGLVVLILQVPGMDIGWWSLLGGNGNPIAGSTDQTAGTPLEWLIPIAFLVLVFPALPLFAEREERWFRLGAEKRSWWDRRLHDLEFGLVHALVGIPIGVALVLSVGGAYFTRCYLRAYKRTASVDAALLESTRAHLTYNAMIVILVLAAFVSDAIASS
jgi:hypothetical protein